MTGGAARMLADPEKGAVVMDRYDVEAREFIDRCVAIQKRHGHSGDPDPLAYERAVAEAAAWARRISRKARANVEHPCG